MAQDLLALSEQTAIARPAEPPPDRATSRDLRSGMMTLPVVEMQTMLAEYKDRRDAFRAWLLPQLQPGVHFGYVPGCVPKFDEAGNMLVWVKGRDGEKGYNMTVTPDQWKAKPSLYKAGAQFVTDVMNAVPVFDADIDAWTQLGKPGGTFVMRCRLYPKGAAQIPENVLGEGRGVRRDGQKGGDANNAIKMAQKCALVDAVLNGYGLADLFTQDTEDSPPPENPDRNPDAPPAQPRGERITPAELQSLVDAFKAYRQKYEMSCDAEAFCRWAEAEHNVKDARRPLSWPKSTWAKAMKECGVNV